MSSRRAALRSLLLETLLYVPLVGAYFFIVLRLLGTTLYEASQAGAHRYAALALVVLLGQAIVLDGAARLIMRAFK